MLGLFKKKKSSGYCVPVLQSRRYPANNENGRGFHLPLLGEDGSIFTVQLFVLEVVLAFQVDLAEPARQLLARPEIPRNDRAKPGFCEK